jgi:hypothetical protein
VCATSERLMEDVENAPGDTLEIAIRKWVDGMTLEVRGFIRCGELNAVTIQPNQEEVTDETLKILMKLINSE